ncbi:hypothetical protein PIROE2DRAFT_15498 [Piromyces sp. E2]|nr:hypothetical protein PIROE2DRAFT_15498 [Piromyces sp. E2]|eukprot:OUM59083.1 hypothetical protein PIROE2DRAFT_15498 [Piromyces sp. E2]
MFKNDNKIIVNNSNEFVNGINICKNTDCIIKINNEIYIEDDLDVTTSLKKLHIVGENKDTTLIHLNNDIFIHGEVEEVIFEDINVHGKIICFDNKRVTLSNINIYGAFKANLTHYPNGFVHINKVNLYANELSQDHGLVIRRCNTTIENSNLYGNDKYEAKLINFSGLNTHYLKILNTFVDGKYHQGGISISASNMYISNSTFINNYSGEFSFG